MKESERLTEHNELGQGIINMQGVTSEEAEARLDETRKWEVKNELLRRIETNETNP